MAQDSGGFDDHFVTRFARTQAEIDIVVVHREGFIEAAEFLEDTFADGQASASDRGDIASEGQPAPILSGKTVAMQVAGAIHDAHGDTGVLDSARGVQKPSANDAYFPAASMTEHVLQPGGIERFDII